MTGSLHIFRRHVANGSDIYQVNYSFTGHSFAKTFGSQHELRDFLLVGAGLEPAALDSAWEQITHEGNATVDNIDISPQQAASYGMTHAEVDF